MDFAGRRLYAIVDVDACAAAGLAPLDAARAFLDGGARLLQVRAKSMPAAAFLDLVDAVRAAAAGVGAAVVTNDRVDVAAVSRTGVHVGQRDLPVADARRLLGPGAIVGVSTHTPGQLDEALRTPADYVAYGPVFATRTKADPDPVVGLDGIARAAARAHRAGRPLVAIGGITAAQAPSVLEAGADAVAVIGDLLGGSGGAAAQVRRFLAALS